MKLSPLQISLGISIVFHLLVVGAVVIDKYTCAPPSMAPPEPVMTLTMVAAPEENIEPPKPIAALPAMPKVEPPRIIATMASIAPVMPVAKRESVMATTDAPPPLQTTANAAPLEKATGDGSSLQPGLDPATMQSPPLVKAQPDYLKNPEPPYPPAALRRHQAGLVLLIVEVTAHGQVAHLEIKKSSGHPILDEAAQKAVSGWQFKPARLGPLAIDSEIEVPVRFELKETD